MVLGGPHAFIEQAVSTAWQKAGRRACKGIRNLKLTHTYDPA